MCILFRVTWAKFRSHTISHNSASKRANNFFNHYFIIRFCVCVCRISGWKQKEHPMLYNALHIGDQIISIGGITITNAKEANKIINNSTGQFVSKTLLIIQEKFQNYMISAKDW